MTHGDDPAGDDVVDRVRRLADEVVAPTDLELVDVEVKQGRGRGLVRVVVDRKGGVSLDACGDVSRRLSRVLDEHDPLERGYTLEVTSPGVARPLTDRHAFDRIEGRDVAIAHRDADDTVRSVEGSVVEAGPDAVVVRLADGTRREIAYARITAATQRLPW